MLARSRRYAGRSWGPRGREVVAITALLQKGSTHQGGAHSKTCPILRIQNHAPPPCLPAASALERANRHVTSTKMQPKQCQNSLKNTLCVHMGGVHSKTCALSPPKVKVPSPCLRGGSALEKTASALMVTELWLVPCCAYLVTPLRQWCWGLAVRRGNTCAMHPLKSASPSL